ncbi:processed acidic surface protein [Anaerobacillus alkaliphilus]|nr:processed acidic surface protein [Anaerobacillus alkaliphilus]
MKRSVFLFLCVCLLVSNVTQVLADSQVNQEKLDQYLSSLDWTIGDLEEYLSFFNSSIEDYESYEELIADLGSPITNDNLNELLGKYDLSYNDLEILLAEYGESLDDYTFIEDLELDVQFLLKNREDFSIVNDFLSLFGLTEAEMKNLFDHFAKEVDQNLVDNILQSLEAMSYMQGVEELSELEQENLFTLWNEMLTALQVDARFYLVKDDAMTPIELENISKETLEGHSLYMALHNLEGDVLATLVFSEEMLYTHLMYESLEQLAVIANLADEYQEMLFASRLPITAGHFVRNILLSFLFILAGLTTLLAVRRRVNV